MTDTERRERDARIARGGRGERGDGDADGAADGRGRRGGKREGMDMTNEEKAEFAAKSAVYDPPPRVVIPLYAQDLRPTPLERVLIEEMYEWERQSARARFRIG